MALTNSGFVESTIIVLSIFFIMYYFMFKVIRMLFVLCHTDYESKLFSVVCCAFEMICVFPCD